jgi:FAD-dependent oxidoreductase family protein/homeodomain-containing protein
MARANCTGLAPGEIGHRLGRRVLSEVANVARPDTILAWYRTLVSRKFDGSKARRSPGRPPISREVELLIVRMAEENRDWGYDRIAGALANLGYEVCDQTVGNVLQRHGLPPAPERKRTTTWSAFIRIHLELLAGTDFFTAEVLTLHGLVTYYVLFFIHLEKPPGGHRRGVGSPGRAMDAADRPQRDHGGMRRPSGSACMERLILRGVINDTFETSITWERFEKFHDAIKDATGNAILETTGRKGQVTCRFTHAYPDGPAPYFTIHALGEPGKLGAQWLAIKSAALDAVIANGGTVTHHHAVGRDHRPWYDRQRPPLFAEALRAAKKALDPQGLLNPGVLIDP